MAPPGPGTMAQVCTLGYCHRANAGRAASRAAQLEQAREPRLPWPCPPTAQREGEAHSHMVNEAAWEVLMGRVSMPTSSVYSTHPLLSSPFPVFLPPSSSCPWPTPSYHSLNDRQKQLHALPQEWCQQTTTMRMGHLSIVA